MILNFHPWYFINGWHSSPEQCTMHDIDVVQRIVEYFLMHEQQQQQQQQKSGKCNISKLLDNYLAEIARDPNLSVTKFQVLAESLPENVRTCHDGLYRAIDTYLKVTCYPFSFFFLCILLICLFIFGRRE